MAEQPRRIDLPSGQTIWFRPDAHTYWRSFDPQSGKCSGRVPGVSTVSKPLDFRPDALLKWAARTNGEGIAILASDCLGSSDEELRDRLGWLSSAESIWAELERSELTFAHIRDQAAARGTNIHEKVLRALAEGRRIPSLADVSAEERGYAQAVMRFWREHDPEPLQVEQVVYSEEHEFAGRFDLRARVDGEVVLYDLKTGGYLSLAAHAQLAGYEVAARECGVGPSDRQVMVQVAADGSYKLVESQARPEEFLLALSTYRAAGELAKRERQARKRREAVAA